MIIIDRPLGYVSHTPGGLCSTPAVQQLISCSNTFHFNSFKSVIDFLISLHLEKWLRCVRAQMTKQAAINTDLAYSPSITVALFAFLDANWPVYQGVVFHLELTVKEGIHPDLTQSSYCNPPPCSAGRCFHVAGRTCLLTLAFKQLINLCIKNIHLVGWIYCTLCFQSCFPL